MVGERGFEPPAPTTRMWCATRLHYSPNFLSHEAMIQLQLEAEFSSWLPDEAHSHRQWRRTYYLLSWANATGVL